MLRSLTARMSVLLARVAPAAVQAATLRVESNGVDARFVVNPDKPRL